MRYPVSGSNAAAITPATASARVAVYGVTSGRVFWLRGVSVAINATNGPLVLLDATVGSTATTPSLVVDLATASGGTPISTIVREFAAPGIKFATNCVAMMNASGSIPIGEVTVWGYEE